MSKNALLNLDKTIPLNKSVESIDDVVTLTGIFFKNIVDQFPILNIASNTIIEYYNAKTENARRKEIKSFLQKLATRTTALELKQETKDYFDNSLIFHLEEIKQKLISNPGKDFDEIFSFFIANALEDLLTPPEEKDLVLSSLLSLDKVDIKVMQQIDIIFNKNLNQGKHSGAEVKTLEETLLSEGISRIMISRSLERLKSQDLIQSIANNGATAQEALSVKELSMGIKSNQYYPTGGFIISEFGRIFEKLANTSAFKTS